MDLNPQMLIPHIFNLALPVLFPLPISCTCTVLVTPIVVVVSVVSSVAVVVVVVTPPFSERKELCFCYRQTLRVGAGAAEVGKRWLR